MPTIHKINSIKIDIYSRDHLPPHFHAIYGEYEALIIIKTLKVYTGALPKSQFNSVIQWASSAQVRQMLLNNFNRLNPNLRK